MELPSRRKGDETPGTGGLLAGERMEPEVEAILPLMGDRVLLLHGPREELPGDPSGHDYDCAVRGLDLTWPVRLRDWRVCQCFHYDLGGWFWVLERDGRVLRIDTVEDALGVGRDAFPTARFTGPGVTAAPSAVRAAYLVAKRVRKGTRSGAEWQGISKLAREDPLIFLESLGVALGARLRELLGGFALLGMPPDAKSLRRARALLLVRRFGSPGRVVAAIGRGGLRYVERITRPTGLVVLVAGPDGSGKSTMAARLPELCHDLFRGTARIHWRPGVMPRPGAVLGRPHPDPATPHARTPFGPGRSAVLAAYYWLDFLLGGWVRIAPGRWRSKLVVVERGWWDLAVDPARYRLEVPRWLVRALGAILPKPDLALVLEADASELARRKNELDEPELARQMKAWRTALPARTPTAFIDSTGGIALTQRLMREAVVEFLERRTLSRVPAGWAALPPGESVRWLLPRGPRRVAGRSLELFQPMTRRGRIGWMVTRLASVAGGFRLLPRAGPPPPAVRRMLASHMPPRSSVAVGRANYPRRFIAMIVPAAGRDRALGHGWIAKIGTDPRAEPALRSEAEAIERLGPLLAPPLYPPTLIAREPGVLVLEAERWRPRKRSWFLEQDVARALGRFFAAGSSEGGSGPAHGDFAPWNLLRTDRGWLVIDWESALGEAPPLYDVFHYLVQGAVLLGSPKRNELLAGLGGATGWISAAIRAYSEGASREIGDPRPLFREYLRLSRERMHLEPRPPLRAIRAREELLRELGS